MEKKEKVNLFTEFKIKGITLKNRVVLPPMVRFSLIGKDGYVTDDLVEWYEEIALGGVGMIILEACCVAQDGKLRDNQIGIWDDSFIEGLTKVADVCRKHKTPTLIQLHHAGFKEGIADVSEEKLDEILEEFIAAFHRAKKCGFDGIEIHGAHTYLISQLHSKLWNKRTDKYGDRLYFTRELIKRTKEIFDDNFILGIRIGGNEPTLEEGIYIAKEVEKAGVDLIHVSSGVPDPSFKQDRKIDMPADFPLDWVVYLGVEIRKHVKTPVIAVRAIKKEVEASYLIENDLVELVAVGRAMISRPHWISWAEKKYKFRKNTGGKLL
ncbi:MULTISPECIES: NADH:flavin oxidoreductase [Psychrilyobacter]|uniref:NADH:flavin oxidoreductase n=1 Tax=Psychrilyobacter TaxID=623282 RepID=UPI001F3E3B6C|nr:MULTISPECIES: NADH:flavin oxidoreductase [Psychrilyobacter]MCS5421641.1 NADH:flavin oxidoreductase [Psychrilyobacter sp. S5]